MSKITLLVRPFPSANTIVIGDKRPIVVDTGFDSDAHQLDTLLRSAGVEPEAVSLIINTHHHSDHVGGNHYMQRRYATPIASHKWEAELINRQAPEAFLSQYLDQPVEPFTVTSKLSDGDIIEAGQLSLRILHTPGHTLGHIAMYVEEEKTLICGDTLYAGDVGWLNIFREGVGALERALESINRLANLEVQRCLPGHGPELDLVDSLKLARRRYESWLNDPQKLAWHGCKRIFAFALMIRGGIKKEHVVTYLLEQDWLQDFAKYLFKTEPLAVAEELVEQLTGSKAASWKQNRLVINTPYTQPSDQWIAHFFPDKFSEMA